MSRVIQVYEYSGSSGDDRFVSAPPTNGDVLVGEASTQTLTNKTHTAPVLNTPTLNLTVAALAALGADQAGAAPIVSASGAFIHATGADATKGIRLPAAVAGKIFIIKNADAANAVLKIYPATGDAINAIAADGAFSIAAKTSVILVALDATTWLSIPLLPS